MYRGLAPHKIMPMPGTHNQIKPTRAQTPQVELGLVGAAGLF